MEGLRVPDLDFNTLISALDAPDDELIETIPWLEESARDPRSFFKTLAEYQRAVSSNRPKSRVFEGYSFYHDMVLRHLRGPAVALQSYHAGSWIAMGYPELHARALGMAQHWRDAGVAAGACVCIVLPTGADFLVCLLSALQLGCVLSYLEPTGTAWVRKRLEILAPDAVVTSSLYRALLPDDAEPILCGQAPRNGSPADPHTYTPDEPVARLFSLVGEDPLLPQDLTAHRAYTWALRDAVCVHRLKPGELLAAPGMPAQQWQPALTFSCLLAGAGQVEIEMMPLCNQPSLLADFPLRSVILCARLRGVLLKWREKLRFPHWQSWSKNPEEPLDWDRDRRMILKLGLEKVPAANLVVDAAAGGALVFSVLRPGRLHQNVLPAPGLCWQLSELNLSGQEAVGNSGVFSPREGAAPFPSYMILSQREGECLYAGTLKPRRTGAHYPSAELLECAARFDFAVGASLVPVQTGALAGAYAFVLLLFTGPERDWRDKEADRKQALTRGLTRQLGARWLPDRIEIVPLLPRRLEDGSIDHDWCWDQFYAGWLHRKARSPIFQSLHGLRKKLEMAQAP